MTTKSRTKQTYEDLKQDLLAAKYLPGSKLKIDQLCDALGVSPGAVREALARLTSDGLVVAEPQRGFVVAPVSAEDLIDLTEVRIEIETRCLRRAIKVGDLAWEGLILSSLHQLSHCPVKIADGDALIMNPEWSRLHSAFHDNLIAACDSTWWLRLRDQLYTQAERYRHLLVPFAKVERDVDAEHKALAEAAIARDADRACDLLAKHLQMTADVLLASEAPFADMPLGAPLPES
jgi:DNA-binding GntR family transcriptional regulator